MAVSLKKRENDMQLSEYVVGWGTLALINAGIAQGKNRRGYVWFLLSLIMGPIATCLLLVFPKKPGS